MCGLDQDGRASEVQALWRLERNWSKDCHLTRRQWLGLGISTRRLWEEHGEFYTGEHEETALWPGDILIGAGEAWQPRSTVAHGSSRSPMTGVAHNHSKRYSPAQRATTLSLEACLRMQIMGGAALSNPVVRAACMHSNSAIWARAMLISFLLVVFRLA